MTLPLLATILGMLAGLGLTLIVAGRAPRQPDLAAAMDRLHPTWQVTAPAPRAGAGEAASPRDRVGYWLQRHVPEASWGATPRDLAVLRIPPHQHLGHKAAGAALGFGVPAVVALLGPVLGMGIFTALPAAVSLVGLLVGWYLPDQQVRSAARRARSDSLRAVSAYYDLVSVKLANAAAPESAIQDAASVGDSWVFVQIRQALVHATEVRGEPGSAGLAALGQQTDMPELTDMGEIMDLSTLRGAAVREVVAARADGLRVKLLADDHAAANAANTKLGIATGGLAVTVMVLLATPALLSLLAAG